MKAIFIDIDSKGAIKPAYEMTYLPRVGEFVVINGKWFMVDDIVYHIDGKLVEIYIEESDPKKRR